MKTVGEKLHEAAQCANDQFPSLHVALRLNGIVVSGYHPKKHIHYSHTIPYHEMDVAKLNPLLYAILVVTRAIKAVPKGPLLEPYLHIMKAEEENPEGKGGSHES